jgi:hypothetical protein
MSEQHQVANRIGGSVDAHLLKEIRILATQQGRRLNILIDEAIRDLLKKYRHRVTVTSLPQNKENPAEGSALTE